MYSRGMKLLSTTCDWCGAALTRKIVVHVKRHYCDLECKSQFQRSQKPVTREWLAQKYSVEGMNCTEISVIVGRDPKSVWNWLKDFGIETRRRGVSSPTRFKKGAGSAWKGRKHSAETRKRLSEIAKADGRVPYNPAVGPYMRGRKGAETPSWRGGHTPERQKLYATPEWMAVAKKVKKRDDNSCQRCGKIKIPGDGVAFDIHHIVSFSDSVELRASLSNLVYVCEVCHYWIHSKENTERLFIGEKPGA